MATTDIYHVVGSLKPARKATRFLGGDVDDGIQIDAWAAARVAANDTTGTITAWIMVPDITGTYTIVGAGDANAVEYIHFSVEAGKLFAVCVDATVTAWDTNSTNVVIKPHVWQHVALVHDGTRPHFFVDGVEVAYTDTTTTALTKWFADTDGIDGAHIGAADSIAGGALLTQEFKGAISDVKYWNAALTAQQVKDDYDGKPNTTNLVLHIDHDEDYVDNGSGATNGTAVGDILLHNAWSEFSSRLSYTCGTPVVADTLAFSTHNNEGHAIVIQAA